MSDLLWETKAAADLGMPKIYLSAEGLEHIRLGHRDIAELSHTLIKSAVEQTTAVYYGHSGRFVFVSDEVTTKGGSSMAIIIERDEAGGKVVTATWTRQRRPPLIWDVSEGLYSHFDADSDVLYLSVGEARESYGEPSEDSLDIWLRYADDNDDPTGVTIFSASAKSKEAIDSLIKVVATHLGISVAPVKRRIEQALGVQ